MSLESLKHIDQKQVDAVKAYLKLALRLGIAKETKKYSEGAYELKHFVEDFCDEINHRMYIHHESATKACSDLGFKVRPSYRNCEGGWNYEVALKIKREPSGHPLSIVETLAKQAA